MSRDIVMSMLYIWWVGITCALIVLLAAMSLPIAVGQYRLYALARVLQYTSIVLVTVFLSQLYNPIVALALSIVLIVSVMGVAHIRIVRTHLSRMLKPYHGRMVSFVSRHSIFEMISDNRALSDKVGVSSEDELLAIINGAAFIDHSHRKDIARFIPLLTKRVSDFMEPLEGIVSIQEDDVIGPLLLDELHSSGQHSFLVIAKSGAIKGTVKLTQLTEGSKGVTKVQDIMDRHIVDVSPDMSAQEAFQILVREQVWLGVVRDAREPSVISLQTIARALLGKAQR